MLSRRHTSHASEDHGIDLAPMLDFVLNLLIFFIITTSFVTRGGRARSAGPRRRQRSTPTAGTS